MRRDARKDARGVRASGLDDAAVAHGLLDAESGEHARDHDEYERVCHPASGAHTSAKAERIVDRGGHAWVDVRVREALRLERERVREEPVVVQDRPETKLSSFLRVIRFGAISLPCVSENDRVFGEEVAVVDVVFHQAMWDR